MQETLIRFLVRKTPWRRDRLPSPVFLGFSGGSDGKESACNAGDLGSIPGLGRSPEGGHDNPLQYSCLENPHEQRNLVGYSHGVTKSDCTLSSVDTILLHLSLFSYFKKYFGLWFRYIYFWNFLTSVLLFRKYISGISHMKIYSILQIIR